MSDLVERLRTAARKACERHNRVDQFDPTRERKPKDFIEWDAADRIELLETVVDAAKADEAERYHLYRSSRHTRLELHTALEALENKDDKDDTN